ncbi:hypothetical protein QUF72_05020 [Desulfobacterales bacterium HSG2]|nr:hypothetical protein [Desulfobacterales bacterium HSG2]
MTTDRRIKRICPLNPPLIREYPFHPRNPLSCLIREYPFHPEIRCHIPGPPKIRYNQQLNTKH